MRRFANGQDLSVRDGIEERDDDDSEWEFDIKENNELTAQYEKNSDQVYEDYDSQESSDSRSFHSARNHSGSESYCSESEDESEASELPV